MAFHVGQEHPTRRVVPLLNLTRRARSGQQRNPIKLRRPIQFTSFSSSDAIALCFISGCDSGDSKSGSRGSSGLIKCARMQTFGSETSRTDKVLALYVGSFVSGAAAGSCERRKFLANRTSCGGLIDLPEHPPEGIALSYEQE